MNNQNHTFTQFLVAIVLFLVVVNLLPERYRLLAGGVILLGALTVHPEAFQGFTDWLKGL